jgi:UDP-N-acetyl-D-glucosamine dehydrogenase
MITQMSILAKIKEHKAVVGVIGMGYVGLPLALAFAKVGFHVIGLDSDQRKVSAINDGRSYIGDITSEILARYVSNANPADGVGSMQATGDYAALGDCDAIFICVPTPLDEYKAPDLSFITGASESILPYLKPGQLVVLQSTTYPGTTDEIVQPILERSGLKAGKDFCLAFSPERIDPGNPKWNVGNTPKIVGGVTPGCTDGAALLLRQIYDNVHTVSSPRVAEMTKLLENIFRSVNIALVNELALLSERMGIDIWEVVEAAKTKPFGFMPFYPSPGVGGHCIAVDPYYLSWKARKFDFYTKFIEFAAEMNQQMPYHTVELIGEALSRRGKGIQGAKVLLIGVAFKANVEDARNSPSERVTELLLSRGAEVSYHDPHVPRFEIRPNAFYDGRRLLQSVPLTPSILAEHDCAAILVKHRNVDYACILQHAPVIVDAVNATAGLEGADDKIIRLGVGREKKRF